MYHCGSRRVNKKVSYKILAIKVFLARKKEENRRIHTCVTYEVSYTVPGVYIEYVSDEENM